MTKTVQSYLHDTEAYSDSLDVLAHRYQYLSYGITEPIMDYIKKQILIQPTVFMFSGSWRLDFDATYLELKIAQHYPLPFAKGTLFVEPNHLELFDLTLKSLRPVHLAIIHSDYWVGHRPIDDVVTHLDYLTRYVQPGGQVFCTVTLRNVNFNRLTTSYNDLGFDIVDDSMIIKRSHCVG
jgi:hypothetical protein